MSGRPPPGGGSRAAPLRILLVDDDDDDALLTRTLLERSPIGAHELVHVRDADSAGRAVSDARFDVCLVDYRLGTADGISLLGDLRRRAADLPVILLTGCGGDDTDLRALWAGASDYLEKSDLRPEVLARAIRYGVARAGRQAGVLKSAERYALAVESSHASVWDWDVAHELLTLSPNWYRLVGQSPAAGPVRLGDWLELVHPEDLPALEEALLVPGETVRVGHRLRHSDGSWRYVLATGCALRDASGRVRHLAGTLLDLTSWRRTEEERQDAAAREAAAQRLESLEMLSGWLAHDLNNLLTVILGHAGMAEEAVGAAAPAAPHLRAVQDAAQRCAVIAAELLAFSGRGPVRRSPLDVDSLIERWLPEARALAPSPVRCMHDRGRSVPRIFADPGQLQDALRNLVLNAAEAIGGNPGTITIRTDLVALAPHTRGETYPGDSVPDGRYVLLSVADTGCGMDEATRRRALEPFFSTKAPGRGLGLAAVLGIVRGHGGTMQLRSEPGRGSTIALLFPVAERERPAGTWDLSEIDQEMAST